MKTQIKFKREKIYVKDLKHICMFDRTKPQKTDYPTTHP